MLIPQLPSATACRACSRPDVKIDNFRSRSRALGLTLLVGKLERLADDGYRDPLYCNSRSALWDLAEAGYRAIARRDDGLRGAQALGIIRRIVRDAESALAGRRVPHFDRLFWRERVPLAWVPSARPGAVGEWVQLAPIPDDEEVRAAA